MVKQMFRDANMEGNFTNHSLRATCATQLFGQEFRRLVQKQTGHKSLESLCVYAENQKRAVSNIICPVIDPDSAYSVSDMSIFDSIEVYAS